MSALKTSTTGILLIINQEKVKQWLKIEVKRQKRPDMSDECIVVFYSWLHSNQFNGYICSCGLQRWAWVLSYQMALKGNQFESCCLFSTKRLTALNITRWHGCYCPQDWNKMVNKTMQKSFVVDAVFLVKWMHFDTFSDSAFDI